MPPEPDMWDDIWDPIWDDIWGGSSSSDALVLDFSATTKKFYRTESQDAIPRADSGGHGLSFWFYMPETVSTEQTILHGDTDGSDSSEFRVWLNTSKGVSIFSSDAAGTSTETRNSNQAYSTGWHHFMFTWNGAAIPQGYVDNATNGLGFTTGGGTMYDTALTRLQWGRKFDQTEQYDGKLAYYATFSNVLDATERGDLYNSGDPGDPETAAGSLTCFLPFRNSLSATVGTVDILAQAKADWVTDDGLFVSASSYSAPPLQDIPTIRNGNRIPANGNFDIVMTGDSFADIDHDKRLSLQFADRMAVKFNRVIGMVQMGTNDTGLGISQCTHNSKTGGSFAHTDDPTVDYEVEEFDLGSITPKYYGLPVNGIAIHYTDGPPTGTEFGTQEFSNDSAAHIPGPLGQFLDGDPEVTVELAILQPANDPIASIRLDDGTSQQTITGMDSLDADEFHLLDAMTTDPSSGAVSIDIQPAGGTWPTDKYLQWAGARIKKTGLSSYMGYTGLSGVSWSYDGFGNDTASSGATSKQYSEAQLRDWINKSYESGRTWVICVNLATENKTESEFTTEVGAIIDQWETSRAALGIPASRFVYVLFSQFSHTVGTPGSPGADRKAIEDSVVAFDGLAQTKARTVHVSSYLLTDGNTFHGENDATLGPNDTTGPQYAWLDAYDTANGTTYLADATHQWLDPSELHLGSVDAAFAMSEIVAGTVRSAAGAANTTVVSQTDTTFACVLADRS